MVLPKLCTLVLILAFSSPPALSTGLTYALTPLRHPLANLGNGSYTGSINDSGTVGGTAGKPDGTAPAVLWRINGFVELSLPQGFVTANIYQLSRSENAAGLVGQGNTPPLASAWINGFETTIGTLPGYSQLSAALGTTDQGVVVGYSSGNRIHAFKWFAGVMTDLGDLTGGTSESYAYESNQAGTIVGFAWPGPHDQTHAVYWDGTGIHDIGLPVGFTDGGALSINRQGHILGGFNNPSRGGLFVNGAWTVFSGDPAGTGELTPTRINDLDQCTGEESGLATGAVFMWSPKTGYINVSKKVPGLSGWTSMAGNSINNKGQICGTGYYEYDVGKKRETAFRLDPITTTVSPTSYSVQLGKQASGTLQSLSSVDGNALVVCKFIVPNQIVAPVTVQVDGTLPFAPMNLWLTTTAKTDTAGQFSLTTDLFDWTTNQYDPLDAATSALATTYSAQDCIAKGDISRYVGASNAVRARLRVRQTGPSSSFSWCAAFDQAVWNAVPGN